MNEQPAHASIRELVLRVPEMFIGHPWNNTGLYFLLFEVMRLAIKPETANQCNEMKVTLESESILTIADNGRGLPIETIQIDQSAKLPKIEHILTWYMPSHPQTSYYQKFGYLDYLGCILNVVSERLHIETCFENQWYAITCANGEIVRRLQKIETPDDQIPGTRLTFSPDSALFPGFSFDAEELYRRLLQLKAEYPSIKLILSDRRSDRITDVTLQD